MGTDIKITKKVGVKNQDAPITTDASNINFKGAGVNATVVGSEVTVTITGGGGGGGATNLSYIPAVNDGTVTSDTGTDATIPLADATNAGLMLASEKTKLAGIQAGAEVNVNADWNATSGDAQILNKPTIVNIYNANGILAGARTIDLNGVAINFTDSIGTAGFNTNINDGADDYSYLNQTLGGFNLTAGSSPFSKTLHVDTSGIGVYASGTGGRYNLPNSQPTVNQIPYAASVGQLDFTSVKTINGNSILGSGDVVITAASDTWKLSPAEIFRGVAFNNNTTTTVLEGGVTISTAGTVAAKNISSSSFVNKIIGIAYNASVVSTGRYTGIRGAALLWFIGGGFRYSCSFNVSDTVYGSGCRQFYGLQGSIVDLTYNDSVLVTSLLNCVGVGSDALDTNLQIFSNDATGVATKIDLGVNFPANRTAGAAMTTVYEVQFYNAPGTTTVLYRVENRETAAVATGTISSNLPLGTQGLNFFASRCMGSPITGSGQFVLTGQCGVYSTN